MSERYYRKLNLAQAPDSVMAWMRTLLRDYGGVWPVYDDLGLELCQVHNMRFDDEWLFAGWAIYTVPIPRSPAPLALDWHYPAATMELYDVPTGCVVYLTDGQEPGAYSARPIGEAFVRFAEFVAVGLGLSPRRDVDLNTHQVRLDPYDQLIALWLAEEKTTGLAQISRRLALSPRKLAGRINALGQKGWIFPRRPGWRDSDG